LDPVRINKIRVKYSLLLNFVLLLDSLYLLHRLIVFLFRFFLFNHQVFIPLLITLVLVVLDVNNLVEDLFSFNVVVCDPTNNIDNVNEGVFLDLLSNQRLGIRPLLQVSSLTLDNRQNLIRDSDEGLGRLILNQFIDPAQIILVDQLILFGLGSVEQSLIKLLFEDVATPHLQGLSLFHWPFHCLLGFVL
jgi:hypothetical protein